MTLPVDIAVPYITSARRYLWRAQCDRTSTGDAGPASAFYRRRLDTAGTALPSTFPSRAVLLAAGVLAVEEVIGAGVPELLSYGLSDTAAERLILWLERLSMTTFAYGPRIGQHYEEDDITLMASAARTASTTSDTYEVGDKASLRLDLDITAASGTTPTLHVQIETRAAYSSGTWRIVDAFGPKTTTGSERRTMAALDKFVRVVCTIGGTSPSFTFSLTGTAV